METKTIEFRVYRDGKGNPTCCSDYVRAAFCEFLGSRSFGTKWACLCTQERVYGHEGSDINFLRPVKKCPLWGGKD